MTGSWIASGCGRRTRNTEIIAFPLPAVTSDGERILTGVRDPARQPPPAVLNFIVNGSKLSG
jgi:hypothetical protein